FLQWNQFFFSQSQGRPQEIRQSDAHFACPLWIAAGERADRVQAVEEEMGIDLSLQRAEFRVPSEHVRFHDALLGFARRFLGLKDVEQSDREQILKNPDDQQQLSDVENFGLNVTEALGVRKRLGEAQCREYPESTYDDGGEKMRSNQSREARSLDGNASTRIPC